MVSHNTSRRFMMTSIHFPHPLPFETPHTQLYLFLYDTQTVKGSQEAGGASQNPGELSRSQGTHAHTAHVSSLSTVRVVLDE